MDTIVTGKPAPPTPPTMRLGSVKSCTTTVERLIRMRSKGQVSEELYRSLLWGMNTLLSWHKLKIETDVEQRLTDLEEQLGAKR